MEEKLISFETAKLAKEKGFDLSPYLGIDTDNRLGKLSNYNPKPKQCWYLKITQSLLQKWLREIYGIHINISKVYECSKIPAKFDGWNIYIAGKNFETSYEINNLLISKYFNSYEEALEDGLLNALKLI